MKTKEVLALDYYADNNKDVFQKWLRKIKPFSGVEQNEEIDILLLEKYIGLMQRKYALMIDNINPLYIPKERNMYSITVRNTNTDKDLTYIYSSTLYEGLVKICILFYAVTKSGEYPLADWEGDRKRRAEKLMKMRMNK